MSFATISLKSQPFGMDVHPSRPLIAAGLVTGQLQLYDFEAPDAGTDAEGEGATQKVSSARPHQGACRALCFAADGKTVWSTGADGTLQQRDITTNKPAWRRRGASTTAINALTLLGDVGIATGDDDGTVRCWDIRQHKAALKFSEHGDYISEMLYTDQRNGNALAVGGGDGHLAVFDLRAGRLWARSDPQEDELLSLALLKHGKKLLYGTQAGTIGVFSWGDFGDVTDRILGHPEAVDCMVTHGEDNVITGSADGVIRLVGVHPNKVLGVLGEHGDDAGIERLALSSDGGALISCGQDQAIRLWDIRYLRDDEGDDDDDGGGKGSETGAMLEGVEPAARSGDANDGGVPSKPRKKAAAAGSDSSDSSDDASDAEDDQRKSKKRKRLPEPVNKRGAAIQLGAGFFADL
jgi:WD40 repeat protein